MTFARLSPDLRPTGSGQQSTELRRLTPHALVRAAVVGSRLGGEEEADCRPRHMPANLELVRLAFEAWHRAFGTTPTTLREACSRAFEDPHLAAGLGGLVGDGLVDARCLGAAIRWLRGLEAGGYVFSEGTRRAGFR